MPSEKEQKRLKALLDAFDSGAVQPDELMKAIDAVMAVIDSTSKTLADLVDSTDTQTKKELKKVESKLETAISRLERYSSQIDQDKATKADMEKMSAKVAKEINRVISLIPELPDEFDASDIYQVIEEHKLMLANISDLIVGENIRNALEALPEGEKLAIDAIEGLRDELNKRIESARATTALIARRLDQIGDVAIAGVTDGQVLTYQASTNTWIPTTVSGSGVSDGDKGDITVSGGGTVWTIDNDTIGLDELSATGTPSASTFLRGDNTWATPAGSGDVVKVGTPVNNQVGVWTGDGTIEGDTALTFDTTTDTLLTVNVEVDTLVVDGGVTQAYQLDNTGNNGLHIKGLTTGTLSEVDISSFDADGTDQVALKIFAVGDAGDTDNERLIVGYDPTIPTYRIAAVANGTGTVRPLRIYTGANTTQLVLNTDGTSAFAGDVTVPDEAYGAGWNGSLEVPTKNAIYDKIETISSGITRSVSSITTPTTAGATALTDYVYFVTNTTLTLPTAVGNTNRYTIKCISGTCVVDGDGIETIDGTANITIQVEDSVDLISNNTEWKVV